MGDQSSELALKSFLVLKGVPLEDLAKRQLFGHDLRKCLSGARSFGFAAPALPAIWFDSLNDLYGDDKRLQYFLSNGGSLPPLLAFREMVLGFITEPAALMGLPPGHADIGYQIDFGALYPGMTLSAAIAAHP
jgi:hypothetical protein